MEPWRNAPVSCRAESRSEQRPQRFHYRDRWWPVERVRSEWLESGAAAGDPVWRMFEVEADGRIFQLRVEREGWAWSVRRLD